MGRRMFFTFPITLLLALFCLVYLAAERQEFLLAHK